MPPLQSGTNAIGRGRLMNGSRNDVWPTSVGKSTGLLKFRTISVFTGTFASFCDGMLGAEAFMANADVSPPIANGSTGRYGLMQLAPKPVTQKGPLLKLLSELLIVRV